MRVFLKKFVQKQLERLARETILHYKPVIIGVAGSVGKTSTKEAIYTVLSRSMSVRKSAKSYNNEFGVPLTVLGLDSGFSSPLQWILKLIQARSIASGNADDYPEVLVLEMGSDHLGDVHKLMTVAKPTIGVLTAIAPVHLEFFGSFENVKMEESTIVRELDETDVAVINIDEKETRTTLGKTSAHPISFGVHEDADVRATDVRLFTRSEHGLFGSTFTLHAHGESHKVALPNALSPTHILSALAASAVGVQMKLSLEDIALGLSEFTPPPGRMRYLEGIKHTHLIDDTYNSSPKAAKSALDVLHDFPAGAHTFAVLGDMAELGAETEKLHREVGSYVHKKAETLITVGEKARFMADGARKKGMSPEYVFEFSKAEEAGRFLQERMKEGDIILIKGSQIARLEKVVREVMAEPARAEELLVRQEDYWK